MLLGNIGISDQQLYNYRTGFKAWPVSEQFVVKLICVIIRFGRFDLQRPMRSIYGQMGKGYLEHGSHTRICVDIENIQFGHIWVRGTKHGPLKKSKWTNSIIFQIKRMGQGNPNEKTTTLKIEYVQACMGQVQIELY